MGGESRGSAAEVPRLTEGRYPQSALPCPALLFLPACRSSDASQIPRQRVGGGGLWNQQLPRSSSIPSGEEASKGKETNEKNFEVTEWKK